MTWDPGVGASFTYRMIDDLSAKLGFSKKEGRRMMMGHDNENSGVTVSKAKLLEVLRKNREEHRGAFLAAQKGYREDVIKELDRMLADAREGRNIRVAVGLDAPQDHTKDYDRAIRMLEMCIPEEVFVTEREFDQYVQDEWGWKAQFVGTNAKYSR